MRKATLVLSALVCGVVALGAGEQPQKTSPHGKQPEKAAPKTEQPAEPKPEAKPLPPAKPEDVKSLDSIVKAFYEAPAGNPGKVRDWDRFRSLFVNEARMIPVRHAVHGQGGNELLTMPVDG